MPHPTPTCMYTCANIEAIFLNLYCRNDVIPPENAEEYQNTRYVAELKAATKIDAFATIYHVDARSFFHFASLPVKKKKHIHHGCPNTM